MVGLSAQRSQLTLRVQVTLAQGASLRKASSAVSKLLTSGGLRSSGFETTDTELYENEVPDLAIKLHAISTALATVPVVK